jgi:hypothetical protein
MAPHDLQAELAALRAILHLPSAEPVWLDIKPGPLTASERRQFETRLAIVTTDLDRWDHPL